MSSAHITPVRTYFAVFGALFVLTIVTAVVAYFDLKAMNTVVALTIAVTKATLVVWYFMGVRYNTPLTKVVVVAGPLLAADPVRADDERLPHPGVARRAGPVAAPRLSTTTRRFPGSIASGVSSNLL